MAEVVKKQEGALVNASFEEMSGLGFAETTTEDMSIPFLRILGAQSPQVDENEGAYVNYANNTKKKVDQYEDLLNTMQRMTNAEKLLL